MDMASSRGKELVIVEMDWPESCPSPSNPFPSGANSIPKSPTRQSTWMHDVAGIVTSVSGRRGIFYWGPAWIQNTNLGRSCADNLMLVSKSQARSSLGVCAQI